VNPLALILINSKSPTTTTTVSNTLKGSLTNVLIPNPNNFKVISKVNNEVSITFPVANIFMSFYGIL
jgi:hypothetical protein